MNLTGESTEKLYEELDKLQEGTQIEQVTRFLAESLTDYPDKLEFNKYFCILVINSQKLPTHVLNYKQRKKVVKKVCNVIN